MTGMAVRLDRPPHSAFLLMWGRAPDAWWGCVQFQVTVRAGDAGPAGAVVSELQAAAWVPAAALSKPGWGTPVELPRLDLPADRTAWPAPTGWPSWFAGPWPHGALVLPGGLEVVSGPAWRRRRRT